jgi:chromate reductase
MAQTRKVAVVVGSIRRDSFNRKLALALQKLSPDSLHLNLAEIAALTLYNQDDDANPPAPSVAYKKQIQDADAVLFVTPEYNRSVPGVLKNAIDVGSRPYGKSVFSRKPAAVVSVTGGALGAFGANHHLRQSLVFLDMPTLQQPEMYIGGAPKLFDAEGRLVSDDMRAFLKKFVDAFAAWIERTGLK